MLDSQNNATLILENALFNFKQNVETLASCAHQQLDKVKCFNCLFIKLLIQLMFEVLSACCTVT